ncbi:hypothetical protein F2Q68_00037689 [Brassica cretica]|uniref:Uncharacterized protein n=1 Tax=Brassica cretica TaxID=69181 RepID=A0A8S9H6C1_BRACR|nr:hypothetical protein F2Q68_00037689 [Brassica cretica]
MVMEFKNLFSCFTRGDDNCWNRAKVKKYYRSVFDGEMMKASVRQSCELRHEQRKIRGEDMKIFVAIKTSLI